MAYAKDQVVITAAQRVVLEELRERIESFIEYFNARLAKPYRWTFTGRTLAT